jgi:hypothetical protein
VLERAQALDPADGITAALLRLTQDALAEEQDRERQRAVDESVKELSARFRAPAAGSGAAAVDDWTSPVLALSVLPFQDQTQAGAGSRIGMEAVLQQQLIRELQARGYTIVERRLLDKVLAEIKLGSSELADADTQIRLGKVLASRLMVSGVLTSQGSAVGVTVRAIDTETTQLAMVRSEGGTPAFNPAQLATAIAQGLAQTMQDKYPLKGRIVAVEGEQAIINLGRKHGVAAGQSFNVIQRGEPIELNGRVLGYRDSRIARVTITEVQELLSYGRIAEASSVPQKNQRIVARKE